MVSTFLQDHPFENACKSDNSEPILPFSLPRPAPGLLVVDDTDLMGVVKAWPGLPPATRAAIVNLIHDPSEHNHE
jgi:hypothetical protein